MFLFTPQLGELSESTIGLGKPQISMAESSQLQNKAAKDYTEYYFLQGIQISQRLCNISSACEPGEVIESDTLNTAFIVRLTFSSEKPDSVLFDGLEGANTKPREMISSGFNGLAAAYRECSPSSDCGHARKTGNKLEFNLSSPSGRYFGKGTLDNGRLTLQTQYIYRGSGAEYILEGQKIVEYE
tara:strand:+ start:8583 stop:9137 length:555 start_codon:yes stop_codon:yes gene_type:complete